MKRRTLTSFPPCGGRCRMGGGSSTPTSSDFRRVAGRLSDLPHQGGGGLLLLLVLCFFVAPAPAALRFGLGNAVAKRSAELINKAGSTSSATGDSVAGTLAVCPAG